MCKCGLLQVGHIPVTMHFIMSAGLGTNTEVKSSVQNVRFKMRR